MGVPGQAQPSPPPAGLADSELFAVDAYRREFDARVVEVDDTQRRVALARTAFYPVAAASRATSGRCGSGPAWRRS
jgi:misacylated tRNA(Ala) deacylase